MLHMCGYELLCHTLFICGYDYHSVVFFYIPKNVTLCKDRNKTFYTKTLLCISNGNRELIQFCCSIVAISRTGCTSLPLSFSFRCKYFWRIKLPSAASLGTFGGSSQSPESKLRSITWKFGTSEKSWWKLIYNMTMLEKFHIGHL